MSLVSLILCTKNGMPYLPEAIASVRAQTYRQFEVIVQDACSTDGSIEYLRSVSDLPAIDVVSEPDTGIGDAYNRAVRRCRGDIIGSIDADNLLEPDALAAVIRQFQVYPQAAALYGASHNINADGSRVSTWAPPDFALSGLLACDVVPPFGQSFFSRSVCGAELRFDESMATCADYDLWLRLSAHPIVRVDDVLGSVRRSPKSMTCQPVRYDEFCRDKIAALKRFLARTNQTADEALYRRAAGGIYAWAAQAMSKIAGQNERFLKYLALAADLAPESALVRALQPEITPPAPVEDMHPVPVVSPPPAEADFLQLRWRLGRMVNQTTPLSESDLLAAQNALGHIIDQPELLNLMAGGTPPFPPAMVPLLLHHLGEAWTQGDTSLAESLETIYGKISRHSEAAPLSPKNARRRPASIAQVSTNFIPASRDGGADSTHWAAELNRS